MNQVMSIAWREMKAALASPLAYTFLIIFLLTTMGAFFIQEAFFANNDASLRGLFKWMPVLLLLVAPTLTMRLWSEERKLGTYEILATLPLSPTQLVLGKFFGAFGLLVLALCFTVGLPIVVGIYGDPDWGPIVGGYVAAALLGAAFLALGLVSSMLTQDQFLALFLGWFFCFLAILPGLSFWESFLSPGMADGLRQWSFWSRFDSVERGVIDFKDVVFYLGATAFFLFLNVVLLRWRRFAS